MNRKLVTAISVTCWMIAGAGLKTSYDITKESSTVERMKKRRQRKFKNDDVADFAAYRKRRMFK